MDEFNIEPSQNWVIDRMQPEDALGVTRLFRSVYGDGYPIRTFIDPDALLTENLAGRTISSVARTHRGDIVGHNAIFHSAPSDTIFETGAGVVHKQYRGGKGIFQDLVIHGQKIAGNELRARAIWGEPTCNNIIAQRANRSFSLEPFAVEIDLMPAAAYVKEKSAEGRVTTLMTFMELHPHPHRILAPAVYQTQLEALNQFLSAPREIGVSESQPEDGVASNVKSQIFAFSQVARITVWQIGPDFEASFEIAEKEALAQGVEVLQVWLQLTDPAVGWAADRLRAKNYFLGGLLPHWFGSDGMLMQRTIYPPQWENIQLAFDRSRSLVDMVRADWENCS